MSHSKVHFLASSLIFMLIFICESCLEMLGLQIVLLRKNLKASVALYLHCIFAEIRDFKIPSRRICSS